MTEYEKKNAFKGLITVKKNPNGSGEKAYYASLNIGGSWAQKDGFSRLDALTKIKLVAIDSNITIVEIRG